MSQQLTAKGREKLEANMSTVFDERTKGLSTELQEILLDDMVTALENMLTVLKRAEAKR